VQRRDRDLASQLRRAISSIALNLAEGLGCTGGSARARFETARGSLNEAKTGIQVAVAWGEDFERLSVNAQDPIPNPVQKPLTPSVSGDTPRVMAAINFNNELRRWRKKVHDIPVANQRLASKRYSWLIAFLAQPTERLQIPWADDAFHERVLAPSSQS
jgi:hypothetical protein